LQTQIDQISILLKQQDSQKAVQSVMEYLKSYRKDFHWVGVYLLKDQVLHVGPYAGPVTDHIRIPVGKGVCGTAVLEDKNQLVDDVTTVGNYLACNLETRSEIVVLARDRKGNIVGQIDIDSTKVKAFNREDEKFLEQVATLIAPHLESLQSNII